MHIKPLIETKRYAVICFLLDTTINHDGTPCRSCSFVQDMDDAELALKLGLEFESQMEDFRGTPMEYDEVQVIDMEGFR